MSLAAVAAIIGCAGGGDSGGGTSSTGTGTGTNTTGSGMSVSIPTPTGYREPPGTLELGFLTGQGRAIGDLTLVIQRINLSDEFGTITSDLNTRLNLALSSYTFNVGRLLVPFNGENSRLFESYQLDPTALQQDQGGGSFTTETTFVVKRADGTFNFAWPPDPFPIEARVFPGRSTLLPLFIDDSMFSIQDVPIDNNDPPNTITAAVFDEGRFNAVNQPPIKGFINDYVEFDITAMPNAKKPRLSTQSGSIAAQRVFLTGDNYAVSGGGDSGNFEVLTLFSDQPIVGTFRVPSPLPGRTTPGTFTLLQLDPTDLFNLRKIVALQGVWRPYTSVITGFSSWNMIAFPNSQDGFNQEVVFFERDGTGAIVDFYFGYLDYDLGQIHLFPVSGLVNGTFDPGSEITASITAQFDKSGAPTVAPQETRSGNFSITTAGSLPSGAPSAGSFLVFRI